MFHPMEGDKQARLAVESQLVTTLEPPWNSTSESYR